MIILILAVSFLLDGIVSILITPHSVLYPLFTLVSLLIIYKFKLSNILYLILSAASGFIYGITYNNLLLDTGLFLLIGLIIIYNKPNINNLILVSLLIISLYRITTYLILLFYGYQFNPYYLFKGIYSSLLINIIYIFIMNLLIDKLNKKYNWF